MRRIAALLLILVLASSETAVGQNSSLYQSDSPVGNRPMQLDQDSWTFTPRPPPKRIAKNDIVFVRVDEAARTLAEGDLERRKDAQYSATLSDWVRLRGFEAIKSSPQSDGDPKVAGQVQQLSRAQSELSTRESLAFNIACYVADIRPNGNLVLEAHRAIRVNEESWEISLSGVCRREDLGPDNTVFSRNIVGLKIDKREKGHVHDGYKRGWFLRWFDEFHPF